MAIFCAQQLLFSYYAIYLWRNEPDLSQPKCVRYYYAGVLTQVALMYKSAGFWVNDLSAAKLWAFLAVACKCPHMQLKHTDVRAIKGAFKPTALIMWTRFLMGQLVNVSGACYLFMTL